MMMLSKPANRVMFHLRILLLSYIYLFVWVNVICEPQFKHGITEKNQATNNSSLNLHNYWRRKDNREKKSTSPKTSQLGINNGYHSFYNHSLSNGKLTPSNVESAYNTHGQQSKSRSYIYSRSEISPSRVVSRGGNINYGRQNQYPYSSYQSSYYQQSHRPTNQETIHINQRTNYRNTDRVLVSPVSSEVNNIDDSNKIRRKKQDSPSIRRNIEPKRKNEIENQDASSSNNIDLSSINNRQGNQHKTNQNIQNTSSSTHNARRVNKVLQRPPHTRDDQNIYGSRQNQNQRQFFDNSYLFSSNGRKPFRSPIDNNVSPRNQFDVPPIHKIPVAAQLKDKRPNIVLIMTDDLDIELGSLNYMPRLLRLMGGQGAMFSNAYTTTPMCCPSRSSMLTGMYIHNHEVYTNHQNCSSPQWQNTHERRSFASYLSNAGYRTGYFGKYLNRYNGSHIPPGWHEWGALLMNSKYYNYTVNRNNQFVKYGNRYPQDYYPHVVTKDGINFLRASKQVAKDNPFLLVLSYPAPHGPEDSAPEHAHKFFNASDHHTASYNYAPNPDKQWVLQFTDRMPDIQLKFTDLLMTKRLQTLQTIDSALEEIITEIEKLGELNNTYLFFTSDHGYHLGQFGLTKGKSMPFEFDVKVPFMVRGPGIKEGTTLPQIALNVDLAPTFLDIAGLPRPPHMDGRSVLPVLKSSSTPDETENVPWRDSFLVVSSGRLREEEELEKKEQRSWEREKALEQTLMKATAAMKGANSSHLNGGQSVSLYTSKHERLEEVCQRIEFSSPCKPGQKWHCEKLSWRWKIRKCRQKSNVWQKHCICPFHEGFGTYRKLDARERRKQKNFLKKYVTKDFRSYDPKFIKAFNNIEIPLHFASRDMQNSYRGRKKNKNGKNRYKRSLNEDSKNSMRLTKRDEIGTSLDDQNQNTTHREEGGNHLIDHEQLLSSFWNTNFDSLFAQFEENNETKIDQNLSEEDLKNVKSKNLLLKEISETEDATSHPEEVHLLDKHLTQSSAEIPLRSEVLTDESVQAFVEEEELRDLEEQIHDITDELETLESVSSTTIPTSAMNVSATAANLPKLHGCRANDGHIDCQEEVYENFSAWKSSKVAIEDQIGRLRQQLIVMKNILRHLQSKKPQKVTLFNIYEENSEKDYENEDKPGSDYDNKEKEVKYYDIEDKETKDYDIKDIGDKDFDNEEKIDMDYDNEKEDKDYDNEEKEDNDYESNEKAVHFSIEDDFEATSVDVDKSSHMLERNMTTGEVIPEISESVELKVVDHEGVSRGKANEQGRHKHTVVSSLSKENRRKGLSLPEVGLNFPIVEDVTYNKRKSDVQRNLNKQTSVKDFNYDYDGFDEQEEEEEEEENYDDDEAYYPVSLAALDEDLVKSDNNESIQNKICWCEKRVLKRIKIQEARERKRLEKHKIKEKRLNRKLQRRKKRKRDKARSCNYSKLNCYTHNNDHWKTPPLWTDGNFCFCINSANNTYWCLRTINETHNFLFCEFITGLISYYDLHIDPYQLRNVAFTLSTERVLELHEKLSNLRVCKGADECDGWAPSKKRMKTKENKSDESRNSEVSNTMRKHSKSSSQKFVYGDSTSSLDKTNFEFSTTSLMKRKKLKRLKEREKRRKLRKEQRKLKNSSYRDMITRLSEDPFSFNILSHNENIRLPRKSRHDKKGRRQKRKEKKRQRRKRKRQKKRLAKINQ